MTNLILISLIAVALMGFIIGLKIALSIMRASRPTISGHGEFSSPDTNGNLTFNFMILIILLLGTYWVLLNYGEHNRKIHYKPSIEESIYHKGTY